MSNLERKMIRYQLMNKHQELVRAGAYKTARCILELLRRGYVQLGLCDSEWEAESILESVGLRGHYGRGGYATTFYLKKGGN